MNLRASSLQRISVAIGVFLAATCATAMTASATNEQSATASSSASQAPATAPQDPVDEATPVTTNPSILDSELGAYEGDEAIGAEALRLLESLGGLGVRYDWNRKLHVLAFPADRPEAVAKARAEASPELAKSMEVNLSTMTSDEFKDTQKAIEAAWKPFESEKAFIWYNYNPGLDAFEVTSSVDPEKFDALRKDNPNATFIIKTTDAAPHLDTRYDNPSPFIGGAWTVRDYFGNGCTTGYAVKSTLSGTESITSAGHCGEQGDTFTNPGSGQSQGYVGAKVQDRDILRISGHDYDGQIYVGDTTGSRRDVVSAATFAGNTVFCTSGIYSGQGCDHTVYDLNTTKWYAETGWLYDLVQYDQGTAWAQDGDSGMPAYVGGTTVSIRGMLTSDNGAWGWATKWATVRDDFGVSIVTN